MQNSAVCRGYLDLSDAKRQRSNNHSLRDCIKKGITSIIETERVRSDDRLIAQPRKELTVDLAGQERFSIFENQLSQKEEKME